MKNLMILGLAFTLCTLFVSTLGFSQGYDPNPKECTKGATALEPAAGENVVVGINGENAVNVSSSMTDNTEKKDAKPKKK